MRCKYKKYISAYMDNELGSDRKNTLEAHIEKCPVCKHALRAYQALSGAFKEHTEPGIDVTFRQRAMEAIDKKELLGMSGWLRDIYPLSRRLIPVEAVVAVLLFILVIALGSGTTASVTLDEALFADNLTQEEKIVLEKDNISDDVALELLIGTAGDTNS